MTASRHLEEHPIPDLSQAPLEAWIRGELPAGPKGQEWEHRLRKRVRFTDIYSEKRKETRHEEKVRHGKAAGLSWRRPSEDVAPPGGQEWLLAQLQGLLQTLKGQMESHAGQESEESAPPAPRPERIRPVRTPRSDVPMATARPAELLEPEFAKGRLYFSCPCCRFPAALPVWLAGKKARCPRCYSAIRAPHPGRKLKTRVLENDVESILHPERFEQYYNAHRLIPWLGIPRPKFHPSFHTAAISVLLAILCCWLPFVSGEDDELPEEATLLVSAGGESKGPGFRDRALQTVEQFLAAENVAAKAAFVRDADRVSPLMADWYQRHPLQGAVKPLSIEASGTGFYSGQSQQPVTDVRVELPDGTIAFYTVEHHDSGDRIEWESSVGYSADFASILESGAAPGPRRIRVMAAFDDYYNFAFPDSEKHLCVRLHDPATLEFLGHGYIAESDPQCIPLISALDGSDVDKLLPIQLEVSAVEAGKPHRQVGIVRLIPASGPDSGVMAGGSK